MILWDAFTTLVYVWPPGRATRWHVKVRRWQQAATDALVTNRNLQGSARTVARAANQRAFLH